MLPCKYLDEATTFVLNTAEAVEKAAASRRSAAAWRAGKLARRFELRPPQRPARPDRPRLIAPGEVPKRRKGGNLGNRIALLHAVAHIELNAIDLAWDIIARFGSGMPEDFTDDWVKVADEEAKHFLLIRERLLALGSDYGALDAHDGLWEAAENTAHDIAARLAVVPMVLEARGLDVTPGMIRRFRNSGDEESAAALEIIYRDEIGHVATGERWFRHMAALHNEKPDCYFRRLVRRYFAGQLKPPFNDIARSQAGMTKDYYTALI